MKKIMKLRKIHAKSKKNKKRAAKKNTKNTTKISFRKKFLYQQIESPYNNNEYLINNQSSPFFDDEEEEDSLIITSSKSPKFSEDFDENTEIDLFSFRGLNSTNDESMILNEKPETGKVQIGICLDLNDERK